MPQHSQSAPDTPHSAELLEDLYEILPSLSEFDEQQSLRCAAVISVLAGFWDCVREDVYASEAQVIVEGLRKYYSRERPTDLPMACGAFIVSSYIATAYSADDDAKFVNSLAKLHILRANSILQHKPAA